jgi:hypothetical protein
MSRLSSAPRISSGPGHGRSMTMCVFSTRTATAGTGSCTAWDSCSAIQADRSIQGVAVVAYSLSEILGWVKQDHAAAAPHHDATLTADELALHALHFSRRNSDSRPSWNEGRGLGFAAPAHFRPLSRRDAPDRRVSKREDACGADRGLASQDTQQADGMKGRRYV